MPWLQNTRLHCRVQSLEYREKHIVTNFHEYCICCVILWVQNGKIHWRVRNIHDAGACVTTRVQRTESRKMKVLCRGMSVASTNANMKGQVSCCRASAWRARGGRPGTTVTRALRPREQQPLTLTLLTAAHCCCRPQTFRQVWSQHWRLRGLLTAATRKHDQLYSYIKRKKKPYKFNISK